MPHLLVCGGAPQTLLKWGRFPNPEEFMPREVKPEASSMHSRGYEPVASVL